VRGGRRKEEGGRGKEEGGRRKEVRTYLKCWRSTNSKYFQTENGWFNFNILKKFNVSEAFAKDSGRDLAWRAGWMAWRML
jgi:hypothetical protein